MSRWFYREETLLGDVDRGPFTEEEFKDVVRSGKLKRETLVQRDGQWLKAGDLVGKAIDQAAERLAQAKKSAAEQKRQEKQQAQEEVAKRRAEERQAKQDAAANREVATVPAAEDAAAAATGKSLPPGALECPFCHQVVYPIHRKKGDGSTQAQSCLAITVLSVVTCGIGLIFLVFLPWIGRKSVTLCPNCGTQISG
jgi:uncharacterized membrane protein YdbT with pleckstrin-like domain